jgi:predicted anti-sigma-YlaC factor YlaD
LKVSHGLLLFDTTGSLGFTHRGTLGDRSFATTPTHSNTVDDIALLVLVSKTTGLVWPSWPVGEK